MELGLGGSQEPLTGTSVPLECQVQGVRTLPAFCQALLMNDEGSDPGNHQGGGCLRRKVDPNLFVTWRPRFSNLGRFAFWMSSMLQRLI